MSQQDAIAVYGPSVDTGSKPFHTVYDSDDELLAVQNALLEPEAPRSPAGRFKTPTASPRPDLDPAYGGVSAAGVTTDFEG